MSSRELLDALAEAFEAASKTLRQRLSVLDGDTPEEKSLSAVAQARRLHPHLGPRQVEVLKVLEEAGANGTTSGFISRSINYDQPNVYLALSSLSGLGFVIKDATTKPHRYRLAPILSGEKEGVNSP